MILIGVSSTSYIVQVLLETYDKIKNIDDTGNTQHEKLEQFTSMLEFFNGNKTLENDFNHQLYDFFSVVWENDKTHIFRDEDSLLDQLPHNVRIQIFSKFLYTDFLM